ncbi:MAG TPA: TonB-dependent receptor [Usitatibacter sp.]|nr:TonB-dependent receptor [Usitatibacter sp.]
MALAALPSYGATQVAATRLEDLSLEQLTEIHVTSVSRRDERLVDAAASIYVITAEDIRRAGATDLFGVLRLAPNLFVGRGDNNQWVAASRGQIAGTSNKMLVLIDGRTIYTPLFSGVFSDAQYMPVEDIERVEVISGPGGTLWGTNAVNGVINITTKSAAATQGSLANGWAGNFERGVMLRQGGMLGESASYRAYARYRQLDERTLLTGQGAQDESERMLAGFRGDWQRDGASGTLEGEAYKGNVDNLGGHRDLQGGHVLGRWARPTADGGTLRVQAYYDRTDRVHDGSFGEKLDILDVDVQHGWKPHADHDLVVGGGYRASRDRIDNTPLLGFAPADTSQQWANLFVQDEWTVRKGLQLTGGVRAERNPYSGVEWLPTLRFAFDVAPNHLLWGDVTRAVRAPSRIDRDAFTPVLRTNTSFEAERAGVAELGYRAQFTPGLSASVTVFHHRYPNLRTLELTPDMRGIVVSNGFEGRITGIEGWGTWRLTPWWRLDAGFMTMSETITTRPGHVDVGGVGQISNDPRHTAQLRSSWDFGRAWELDVAVRNVGHIPNYDVPAYTVADARIGWRVTRSLDASLAVQNLFDRDYSELGPAGGRAVFRRSWILALRWQT